MLWIFFFVRLYAQSLMGFIPKKTSEPAAFWLASQVWNSRFATVSAFAILWTVLPVARLRTRIATLSEGSNSARAYSEAVSDLGVGVISVLILSPAWLRRWHRNRRGP